LPFQDALTGERIEAIVAKEAVDFGPTPGDLSSVLVTEACHGSSLPAARPVCMQERPDSGSSPVL
jgi:hypothetical protein